MDKRARRRYLTERYQQKQVRLAYIFSYSKPHDTERYGRTKFAKKRRFWDILRGNYVEFEYEFQYDMMLSGFTTSYEFTKAELGRFRNHSFKDCGRSGCPCCGNPRKNGWAKYKDKITLQERKADLQFKEDLQFNNEGG